RAGGEPGPDPRRGRRGAPADRTRPARRRAAAAGRAGHGAGPGPPRSRLGEGAGAAAPGPRGVPPRPDRPARGGLAGVPHRAVGVGAARRAERPGRPLRVPGRPGLPAGPGTGAGHRHRRLLHRRRGGDQRGEALRGRPGLGAGRRGRPAARRRPAGAAGPDLRRRGGRSRPGGRRPGRAGRPGRRGGRPAHRAQPGGRSDRGPRGAAVRVIIAEDSALLREGLVRLLEDEGHTVSAAVGDAGALLDAVAADPPDTVVADVRMPPTHTDEGLRAAVRIRREHPGVGVLVLSQYVERRYAVELFTENTEGVGYLLKDRVVEVEEFLSALERVGSGGAAFDP